MANFLSLNVFLHWMYLTKTPTGQRSLSKSIENLQKIANKNCKKTLKIGNLKFCRCFLVSLWVILGSYYSYLKKSITHYKYMWHETKIIAVEING